MSDDVSKQLQLRDDADKRRAFEAIDEHYGEVWVCALTEADGVDLPASVKAAHKPYVKLQISEKIARPTWFATLDSGLQVSLSFGGISYDCFIPWSAVFLLHGPLDAEGKTHSFRWGNPPPAKPKARPALRVIKGGA
jgi:hypothetical protein